MALQLYMSTIRVVFDIDTDIDNENSWSRIYGSLRCLRKSLLCTSCQKLLMIPQRPLASVCEHSYCKMCVERNKFQCSFCSTSEFEEYTRFRIILQGYKKICRYILSSDICRCWDKTKLTSPMLKFISMVYEGASLEDRYHYVSNSINEPSAKKPKTDYAADDEDEKLESVNTMNQMSLKVDDSVMNMKQPRVVIKKSALADKMLTTTSFSYPNSDYSDIDCPKAITECLNSVKKRRS